MDQKHLLSHFFQRILIWVLTHKYWLTAIILLTALRFLAHNVFWIMVIAFFLYVLMHPLLEYLHTKIKSRRAAALITIVLLTGFLAVTLSLLVPALVSQIFDLIKNYQLITIQIQAMSVYLQQRVQELQEALPGLNQISFKENINQFLLLLSNSLLGFFKDILNSLTKVIASVLQFIVAYILLIYMLFDTRPVEKIKAFLLQETTAKEKKMLTLTYEQITAYFGGQLLMAVMSSIAVWIFYAILGLKFSLLLALWNGFMQFIPFFGPVLAMFPAILVTLPDKSDLILPIIIFFAVQQSILAYIITPHILGKTMRLSPLVVFLVIMVGAEIWGIWGMIFSLPLTSLIIMYIQNIQAKKS